MGFFADQRDNRRALRELAGQGQRWLNLFGHTGAFSVALASRGATALNVDISERYLEWTAENFELNGLDPDLHVPVCEDAREVVDARRRALRRHHHRPADGGAVRGRVLVGAPRAWAICSRRASGGWPTRGVMLVCRNDRAGA